MIAVEMVKGGLDSGGFSKEKMIDSWQQISRKGMKEGGLPKGTLIILDGS